MYPEYTKIDDKLYKINTDFRIAIKCSQIAEDKSIGDYERVLAIIYLLFGEEGLNAREHHNSLMGIARKYLLCDQEYDEKGNEKPDMDYEQDMPYIEASFQSDYGIWLPDIKMHWWKFSALMNGLSNSEMGNCCILNRVRNLRNYDAKKITDSKERKKIIDAQKRVELKKKVNLTEKQKESVRNLIRNIGIKEG